MYTILYLRQNLFLSLLIAVALHVILTTFGREHVIDFPKLLMIITPPLLLTIIIVFVPDIHPSYDGDIFNSGTLGDWEFANLFGYSEWNVQQMVAVAHCKKCALIAAERTLFVRKCQRTHGTPPPNRIRPQWLLFKILVTLPVWGGTVLTAIIIHASFSLRLPSLIVIVISSQLLGVVMTINLESDLCRIAHGVRLIYSKTLLIQIYSVSHLAWMFWDIVHFGTAPDLKRLGIWRYLVYFYYIQVWPIGWLYYELTPGRILNWLTRFENSDLRSTAYAWIRNEKIIKPMEPLIRLSQQQLNKQLLSTILKLVLPWYQCLLSFLTYWEKDWFWGGLCIFLGIALLSKTYRSIQEGRNAVLF